MPVLWIAQLFSMLSVSSLLMETMDSRNARTEPGSSENEYVRSTYSRAAAECLLLADYTKPQRHLVEALFLYCQAKGMATLDPAGEVLCNVFQ